jgi:hypothetical protein
MATMSEQTRAVTTITFSGPRFNDAGLELGVLPELLAYRKLLLEIAKRLWRAESRGRRRLPRGFQESIQFKCYAIENNGSTAVSLKRMVHASELPSAGLDETDEIDEAAQLIDEGIEAIRRDEVLPEWLAKPVLALLARFGATLRPGETVKIQSALTLRPVELTHDVRERIRSFVEAVQHGRTVPKMVTGRIPPKLQPELRVGCTDMLSDAVLQRQPAGYVGSYDLSVRPIWEALVELGENVPAEAWDRVPADLSANLDHYLYHRPE